MLISHVPYLSSFWCLGKVVHCDCGISWVSSLIDGSNEAKHLQFDQCFMGAFMRTEFLCISVFRVESGLRVKLVGLKSALNPPVVYSTGRSKAVVPALVLLFVALLFILEAICFKSSLVLFCSYIFSHFSIAITLLGEERANTAFRTFDRFALVWFCLFPLPFHVWGGLRLVIVALPGFFSYLFCQYKHP